jgi:hypothetical protein
MKPGNLTAEAQELLEQLESFVGERYSRKELHHHLHELLLLLKEALKENSQNTRIITQAYLKLATGKGLSEEEMKTADRALVEELKYLGIAFLGILPGSIFTLRGFVSLARYFDIDLLPDLHIDKD